MPLVVWDDRGEEDGPDQQSRAEQSVGERGREESRGKCAKREGEGRENQKRCWLLVHQSESAGEEEEEEEDRGVESRAGGMNRPGFEGRVHALGE